MNVKYKEYITPSAYYMAEGDVYRNPHETFIDKALRSVLGRWDLDLSNTLDLAAGSGEVTRIVGCNTDRSPMRQSGASGARPPAWRHTMGQILVRVLLDLLG